MRSTNNKIKIGIHNIIIIKISEHNSLLPNSYISVLDYDKNIFIFKYLLRICALNIIATQTRSIH